MKGAHAHSLHHHLLWGDQVCAPFLHLTEGRETVDLMTGRDGVNNHMGIYSLLNQIANSALNTCMSFDTAHKDITEKVQNIFSEIKSPRLVFFHKSCYFRCHHWELCFVRKNKLPGICQFFDSFAETARVLLGYCDWILHDFGKLDHISSGLGNLYMRWRFYKIYNNTLKWRTIQVENLKRNYYISWWNSLLHTLPDQSTWLIRGMTLACHRRTKHHVHCSNGELATTDSF